MTSALPSSDEHDRSLATEDTLSPPRSRVADWLLRQWRRPLRWHVAALAVVLMALVPVMDVHRSFSQDEGVYGVQAQALEEGQWASLPPSVAIDPELRFTPWQGRGIETEDGIVLYSQHPAYPALLSGISALSNVDVALVVTGIGGLLAAAAGAWVLALTIGIASSRMAFWLAAGSPVLHHAYVLWPHSIGAAAAAWSAVFVVRALRTGSLAAWVSASAVMSVGVLFRSESLLFAVALMVGAVIAALRRRAWRSLRGLPVVAGGVLATVGLERVVISAITMSSAQRFDFRGSDLLNRPNAGFVEGRLNALRQTLWDGAFWDGDLRRLAQIGVVFMVLGVIALALTRYTFVAAASAGVGMAFLVMRIVATPADPVPGLVVAWPMVAVAVWGAVRMLKRSDLATEAIILGIAGTAAAIALTQYARGTGLNWAGRYFALLLPLAAVFVSAAWSRQWGVRRATWNVALLASTLIFATLSLVSVHALRSVHGELTDIVERQRVPLAISPIRLPLTQWREDQPWMTVVPGDLGDALDLAAERGVRDVVVLWGGTPPSIRGWAATRVDVFGADTYRLAVYRLSLI